MAGAEDSLAEDSHGMAGAEDSLAEDSVAEAADSAAQHRGGPVECCDTDVMSNVG